MNKKQRTHSKLFRFQIRRAKMGRTCDNQVVRALAIKDGNELAERCPDCLAKIPMGGICYLCLEDEREVE